MPAYTQPAAYLAALETDLENAEASDNQDLAAAIEAEIGHVKKHLGVDDSGDSHDSSPDGLEDLKAADLEDLLAEAGLPTDGRKADKIARLREHTAAAAAPENTQA